jgi:hypothetical protein
MPVRQYTRHSEEVKEFVHMVLRVPNDLHARIAKEQERLRGIGKKMKIQDVAIKIMRDGLPNSHS